MEKNILRSRKFMSLRRMIKSCSTSVQLNGLKEVTLQYHREKQQDSAELLAIYLEKENDLSLEIINK